VAENVNDLPEAVAAPKSRRNVQLVWLIPLIAALVGGWLAVKSIMDRGPVITISFKTAEGLEAGKTKLKYKDVEIGLVNKVELAPDLQSVVVTAELVKKSEAQLVKDTQFWVVRPRISGGSVSGLGTLLSGSYIGVSIGKSAQPKREFIGLEVPPVFTTDDPGREFVLRSPNLGSLDYGSPVYFRRLQVGQITGYVLDKGGNGVTLKVFINKPYDQYVNANTRFWHASGVDLTLDSAGIKVDTQSVVSIVLGGLAFETPAGDTAAGPAEPNAVFELFPHRDAAMKNPDSLVIKMAMAFNESVRGLAVGAPIDFRGLDIGAVTGIKAELNETSRRINIVVELDLYPARLRTRSVTARAELSAKERIAMMDGMVAHGLRAQLRTGNLLTGQLYIALDFFPGVAPAKISWTAKPPELPTTAGSLEDLRTSATSIAKKLDKVDFEGISTDLKETLVSTTKMMKQLDADLAELTPEMRSMMVDARRALVSADRVLAVDSPTLQDARDAMREIGRAAAAFRVLADYLEQHPEALVSGKKQDDKQDGSRQEESKKGEKK
jgi:paraquat-inducible protein B